MGNDSSSTLRGRYDDDETTIDGTSVFSQDTRETGFSGISRDTGMSSRLYRSSSQSVRGGLPGSFGNVLNNNLIDTICGNNFFEDDDYDDDDESRYKGRRRSDRESSRKKNMRKEKRRSRDNSHDDSYESDRSYDSPDNEDRRNRQRRSSSKRGKDKGKSPRSDDSYGSDDFEPRDGDTEKTSPKQSAESSERNDKKDSNISFESIGANAHIKTTLAKPLASSFAKRCYFTKAGIGKNMQHYEGVTLTGNTVLMLARAMKLKGCPTICDEDLRRVEQTFPNQFSRLPDELLLSSGWRRISKYCHFSSKPIPDGVPFFHSRERCHPNGGYYFLLAASIGMERPSDVEPLSLDMLIVLQTDFPTQCDQTPKKLIEEPSQWTLVTRFCFFSGGPINSDEDVYYKADFNGNAIYMLAFLSPNMTPEELYRLNDITGENALKSVAAVEEIETVYDLTERDFDDLKMYHLGPCRALPHHLLDPSSWEKVLPQHFLQCRENALARAFEYEVHAQEAIAKAGKMIGLGHTRDQSYESISNNQPSYELNIGESPAQAPDAPFDSNFHNGTDDEPYHNTSQTQQVGSYVEMHQLSDSQGQFGGSNHRSGEDGTLELDEMQGKNQEHVAIQEMGADPTPTTDQYGRSENYIDQDDPTEHGVIHNNPTPDAVSQKEDPSETGVIQDDPAIGETLIDADDPTIKYLDPIEKTRAVDQCTDPPIGDQDDPTLEMMIPDEGAVYIESHEDPSCEKKVTTSATEDLITEPTATQENESIIDAIDDDPTITDAAEREGVTEKPVVRVIDSEDRALESYYKGIEEQERIEEVIGESEFPSGISDSSDDPFSNQINAVVEEDEKSFLIEDKISIVSKRSHDGEDFVLPGNVLSTPQDSEYVSIQEFDPNSPNNSLHSDSNEEPAEIKSREDPTILAQVEQHENKFEEENVEIKSYAGYGFARQVSSTPRKLNPSSPKHSTTQKQHTTSPKHDTAQRTPPIVINKAEDDLMMEFAPDDETSPRMLPDPPAHGENDPPAHEEEKRLPQPHLASPYGNKNSTTPDFYTQGSSSNAMRGAREILKKNRQERLALMTKRRSVPNKVPQTSSNHPSPVSNNENKDPTRTKTFYSHARSRSVTPNKKRFQSVSPAKRELSPASPSQGLIPKTPPSASRKVSGKDSRLCSPKSDVSGASSGWTEDPDSSDKDSRRALILKMAKNRMRNKKELKSSLHKPAVIN